MRRNPVISGAERFPPHSDARAAFICSAAARAAGLVTTGFLGLGGEGRRPPGWDDYLAGRLDDEGLYRRAQAEAERLVELIAARIERTARNDGEGGGS